jgi:hypothetical protein
MLLSRWFAVVLSLLAGSVLPGCSSRQSERSAERQIESQRQQMEQDEQEFQKLMQQAGQTK